MNIQYKICKMCTNNVPHYRIDPYCSEHCINQAVKDYVATYNYGNIKKRLVN